MLVNPLLLIIKWAPEAPLINCKPYARAPAIQCRAMECENSKLSQTPNLKRSASSSPSPRPGSTSTCTADTDSAGLDRYRRSERSLEERRQHALVACRNRRGAESGLIQDLGRALPVSVVVLKSCDKLAILRLATSYLKLRALLERLEGSGGYDGEDAADMEALLLGRGFVLIMTTDGEIVYVSEKGAEGLHCETVRLTDSALESNTTCLPSTPLYKFSTLNTVACNCIPPYNSSFPGCIWILV